MMNITYSQQRRTIHHTNSYANGKKNLRNKGRGSFEWTQLALFLLSGIVLLLLGIGFLVARWLPLPMKQQKQQNHFVRNKFLNRLNPGLYFNRLKTPTSNSSRIAMILPYYFSTGGDNGDGHGDEKQNQYSDSSYSIMPPYMLTFCAGAASAADLMDFLIFYAADNHGDNDTNNDDMGWPDLRRKCPSNVIFINLGSTKQMAKRLVRVVIHKYNNEKSRIESQKPLISYDDLVNLIGSYLRINPYGLVEFKPALGHIFQDYLDEMGYTHWGYTDMDIIFGDISRWISHDELYDSDIFTYSFGDQERLYLRGQLTVHKNMPETINQIWRHCSYLSDMDTRFYDMVRHQRKYHVESAEGCYSTAIFELLNITVKFAVKAWTDIKRTDSAYTHGVYVTKDIKRRKHILQKLNKQQSSVESALIDSSSLFAQYESIYTDNPNMTLQRQLGEFHRIDIDLNSQHNNSKCMYWILPQYQAKLCLKPGIVTSNDTVYWKNGHLYKQTYENTLDLHSPVISMPFFHFQEWKRLYRYGQLATLYPGSMISTTVLTPEGAVPMIDTTAAVATDGKQRGTTNWGYSSPLGFNEMEMWHGIWNDNRSQLPGHVYCLASKVTYTRSRQETTQCIRSISWHDQKYIQILSGAPEWKYQHSVSTRPANAPEGVESMDVTLVLTFQINVTESISTNENEIRIWIEHLKVSLRRWQGQPCVIVVHAASAEENHEWLQKVLVETLSGESDTVFDSSLIAILYDRPHTFRTSSSESADRTSPHKNVYIPVSRKALLNMAIDAVPTRWYVAGVEIERGLTISTDSAYFSHQVATAHSRVRGNYFWIPQFMLTNDNVSNVSNDEVKDTNRNIHPNLTIQELLEARTKGNVKNLMAWKCPLNKDDERTDNDIPHTIETQWWAQVKDLFNKPDEDQENISDMNGDDHADALDKLEQSILERCMMETTNIKTRYPVIRNMNESPIFLIDNFGPHIGIRTNEIVREVEEFTGLRCYNGLKMTQLAILGYSMGVLVGAFASSSTESYNPLLSYPVGIPFSNWCHGCSITSNSLANSIVESELKRVAKTAILWAESFGEKQQ